VIGVKESIKSGDFSGMLKSGRNEHLGCLTLKKRKIARGRDISGLAAFTTERLLHRKVPFRKRIRVKGKAFQRQ